MRCRLFAWVVDTEPVRTRSLYRLVSKSAAERCGCVDCLNFQAARPQHFPAPFAELLRSLAVDPSKEMGVSLVAPLEGGRSLYSGHYPFCGSLLAGRPQRGFPFLAERVDVFEQVHPEAHVALRTWTGTDAPWRDATCVRLEFLIVLPWILDADRGPLVDLVRSPDGGSLSS